MLKYVALLALLAGGCSQQARCVSILKKSDRRVESCGIKAADTDGELATFCVDLVKDEKRYAEIKERAERILDADTCEGVKLRVQAMVAADDNKKKAEFEQEFKKAVEAGQEEEKKKPVDPNGLGL